jgi:hypothetical protein
VLPRADTGGSSLASADSTSARAVSRPFTSLPFCGLTFPPLPKRHRLNRFPRRAIDSSLTPLSIISFGADLGLDRPEKNKAEGNRVTSSPVSPVPKYMNKHRRFLEISTSDLDSFMLWKVFRKMIRNENPVLLILKILGCGAFFAAMAFLLFLTHQTAGGKF